MIGSVATALMRSLPTETAHGLGLALARMLPTRAPPGSAATATNLCGLRLANPVGLAAGLDKEATAFRGLGSLGFGFIELGTVTPRPQAGNPQPRLFRLVEDAALINRFGFNSGGLDGFQRRLETLARPRVPIGANIGTNRDSPDPVPDYRLCLRRLNGLVDWLTVNVSSPNTKGLRDLQHGEALRRVLDGVLDERAGIAGTGVPLFLKLAPDIDDAQIDAIAAVLERAPPDALILTNTTVSRPASLRSRHASETGGLSGAPLKPLALATLKAFRQRVALPLVAAGGIADAADVRERLAAGATAVQLYTALVYSGPGLVRRIVRDLQQSAAAGPLDQSAPPA